MRPDCQEGNEMFWLLLYLHVWPLTRSGWQGLGLDAPFLPCGNHRAGSIRVLDDGSGPCNWLSVLLLNAAALPTTVLEFIFRITDLASVVLSPCRLQFAVCGVISPIGVFLKVLGTFTLPAVRDCLFRIHLMDAARDVAKGVSDFFPLKKNPYM